MVSVRSRTRPSTWRAAGSGRRIAARGTGEGLYRGAAPAPEPRRPEPAPERGARERSRRRTEPCPLLIAVWSEATFADWERGAVAGAGTERVAATGAVGESG